MWTLVISITTGLVFTVLTGVLVLFYFLPHKLIRLSFLIRQYHAGMKINYVGDEEMIFCYGERNRPQANKPSIVFVHGFSSSKDQWISCFKGLPQDLHMIALDLPGHGFSSFPPEDVQLGIEYVVHTLNKFLKLVGLFDHKIHLVGSSLGGAIVGLYATKHPERVAKVTMICPAMQTPVDSDFAVKLKEALAEGHEKLSFNDSVLLANNIEGLKNLLECSCYNKSALKISDQFFKGFLTLRLPKMEFYLRLFKAITTEENFDLLANIAHEIVVPSQLIWGKQDELIHVSGADVLSARLPNCYYVDIIDNCGHAVDLDRPGILNKHLLKFIREDCCKEINTKKSD
ncbi:monoacylglycerol lipase ABHD6-like [Biomphalaria glabrata]|uniref:acylglycerol lipase n=1 Tax=Biomphalaria glabrata TaxID=6526 RepID=A0A9W2YHI1_BIOGL|nr:monoacylglycerol lipase ABHD6-like [Biomphalaria glabrata]XP_055862183.1 monoacylglycerol lipase ABHD6-like [Biomphalaria glabrata]XP_055862184.1 monoacylglycerol lipase ABHD6-like [Biomphalaria glabrata]